jgi:hypothetical protein
MPSTPLEIAEQLTTDAVTAANHLMMALIEAGMSLCQPSTVIGEMYLQSRGNGLLSPAVDNRLKAIEQQLITNDGEYKALLRQSNQVQSDANELIELRTRSSQMQEDADELQALRQQHEQRRNTQPRCPA